ncbi:MarR family transcriptional regulator [Halomonas sp. hl-4]|uniref:MarR family transcriptional regulator n=1 Tax=Halomonas sp. hl-4 TaxID=1761789 RepID=UPI000BB92AED|nr:MarR family transcriptional regulator [Halomonas sp. hl-4]SNY97435.1 transcriptional regulator, MarR family [Halomonas sp. hl-4]
MDQEYRLDKHAFECLSQFRYQLRCFLRHSEDICRRYGLTPLQYQLLLHLQGFRGRNWATVGELADRLQSKHHGTVALINRCEQLELVERCQGREDRRQIEVHLTAKGAELVSQIAAEHQPELQLLQKDMAFPAWGSKA